MLGTRHRGTDSATQIIPIVVLTAPARCRCRLLFGSPVLRLPTGAHMLSIPSSKLIDQTRLRGMERLRRRCEHLVRCFPGIVILGGVKPV